MSTGEFEPQTFILPFESVQGQFHYGIQPWITVPCEFLNISHLVYQLVENRLWGDVMACSTIISTQLQSYDIPKEAADIILTAACDQINLLFNRIIPYPVDGWVWVFEFSNRGDLKLTNLGKVKPRVDPEAAFIASIKEGLARGDYYPESFRRLAGML